MNHFRQIIKTNKATILLLVIALCSSFSVKSQILTLEDSVKNNKATDSAKAAAIAKENAAINKVSRYSKDTIFSPRKATIRSAILPGWGQVYNHQIWKLPFVYGAIGTTAGIFIYNIKLYRELRNAYIYKTDTISANDGLISYRLQRYSANDLQRNRDIFRQNVDYSVLAFLIAWGINVVDATVSAHLRQFDVTDDLSLKIRPTLNPRTGFGIGLVMNFK